MNTEQISKLMDALTNLSQVLRSIRPVDVADLGPLDTASLSDVRYMLRHMEENGDKLKAAVTSNNAAIQIMLDLLKAAHA